MVSLDTDMFKKKCLEYPPDMDLIRKLLSEAGDLNELPYDDNDNFLSEIINCSVDRNPCNTCEALEKDLISDTFDYCREHEVECDNKEKILSTRDGHYVANIVEAILDSGFDANAHEGLFATQCWMELIYSTFDRYMVDIAKVLLKHNINPPKHLGGDETAKLYLDWVEIHEFAAHAGHNNPEEDRGFRELYELIEDLKV